MKKIAFLDTVHPVLKEGLEDKNWNCIDMTEWSRSAIEKEIDNVQGIVVRSRFPLDEGFLSKAVQLEFIARAGAGLENIDQNYCKARNIKIFNAPEGNRNAVGEHALGMLLTLFNKLHLADAEVRSGKWNRESNRGIELDGKTIGIIGYGNNGSAFANKLRGFDVQLLAYDKYKKGFGNEFVKEVDLSFIQEKADILSFHIPENEETRWMFNHQFLGAFNKPIFVINLSRGKIIRTKDLVDGLKTGKVLGTCLDVLEYEKTSFENMFEKENKLPDAFNYLLQSDKVIFSPHVGGWTVESYYKLSKVLLDKICNFFEY